MKTERGRDWYARIMPDQVPMLGGADICRGVSEDGKGCRCLTGWVQFAFAPLPGLVPIHLIDSIVCESIYSALAELIGTPKSGRGIYISRVNDELRDRRWNARVWNRAMWLLDYTEGNRESAPLPRLVDWRRKRRKKWGQGA